MTLSSTSWRHSRRVSAWIAAAALLSLGFAASQSASAAKPKLVASMVSVRASCTAVPVALATLRTARQPVKAGTVTYSLGSFKEVYQVFLAPSRDGIAWTAYHPKEKQSAESGTIPGAALSGLGNGHVRLIVARLGRQVAKGERRVALFSHFQDDCQTALIISGKPASGRIARSEAVMKGDTSLPVSGKPTGPSHAALPWLNGARGYAQAMGKRSPKKKAVALFFGGSSRDSRNFDAEVLTACRVNEFLDKMLRVRLYPQMNAQDRAIAAKYGVKQFPTFLIIPQGADQAQTIVPAPGVTVASMKPCSFIEQCDKALKKKR